MCWSVRREWEECADKEKEGIELLLFVVERVFIRDELRKHDANFVCIVSVELVPHEAHVNFDANLTSERMHKAAVMCK